MKHYCVISHTHWDREWYQTQEEFRMRLVDLFDHLLEILDANPDYIFHMDAQTIVFEDYWEIRPEMKEKCCDYIKKGRILAGPWYVQNDFFLTSGEATVRNLLIGMQQANEMGGCGKTGYTPDQFGLISQLPQIYAGFEIDHCVFGRGYMGFEKQEDGTIGTKLKPSEFLWKSPNGSEVLAICMPHWYNNAQRFSADVDRAVKLVKNIEQSFEGVATTPYLLLMNGVDHLEPQPDLLPILGEIQNRLSDEEQIYQTSIEEYVDLVRGSIDKQDMSVEMGELMQGRDLNLLKDTASSRMYLKIMNSELQNMLENRLEPLYALLELSGMKGVYPSGHLDYLWKMLIRNHAHDSICGCSTDAVHRHMEDRFETLGEMCKELQRRGMKQLADHVNDGFSMDDYKIVVFNGLEEARTETVEVNVDIVASDEPRGLRILDSRGEEVPFAILKQETFGKSVFSAINLPGTLDTIRYQIRMLAKEVPAFGYAVYRVCIDSPSSKGELQRKVASCDETNYFLENDALKVTIAADGKVSLFHKETMQNFEDVLSVEDAADDGNAYIFLGTQGDKLINVTEHVSKITVEESDAFYGSIRLHYGVTLPECLDKTTKKRSDKTVTMPFEILLSLKQGAESLDVRFSLENKAKDHRMNARICTGIQSDVVAASTPYDIAYRNKWDIDKQICNETEHNSGMVAITQGQQGFTVLNRGIYAYEHLQEEQGVLTFPIVRSTGEISGGVDSDDDAWKIPENQCLRLVECEISLQPLTGNEMVAKAAFASKAFQNPLLVQCEPMDTRKFLGGRAAVQDTSIAELFYQEVPYGDVKLDAQGFGFVCKGEGLQVTALKKSFDRSGYILRFYNENAKDTIAKLYLGDLHVQRVWKSNLMETTREELAISDGVVRIPVGAKEIITLFMQ